MLKETVLMKHWIFMIFPCQKDGLLQLKELVLILQRKQPLFDLRRLMGVVQISLS
ncbi:hypothetical protein D3C79_1046760 [compost metagenome]